MLWSLQQDIHFPSGFYILKVVNLILFLELGHIKTFHTNFLNCTAKYLWLKWWSLRANLCLPQTIEIWLCSLVKNKTIQAYFVFVQNKAQKCSFLCLCFISLETCESDLSTIVLLYSVRVSLMQVSLSLIYVSHRHVWNLAAYWRYTIYTHTSFLIFNKAKPWYLYFSTVLSVAFMWPMPFDISMFLH